MFIKNRYLNKKYEFNLGRPGITLAELMVAISVAAIVMLAAYALFSSSLRQFGEGPSQLDAQRNARKMVSFFRKKFLSAVSGLKLVDIGDKAPTGLSTGIEFNVIAPDSEKQLSSDPFYKTVTETYYLSQGKIMFKSDLSRQPRVLFDSVKSVYFKIFSVKRKNSSMPVILMSITTFNGKQTASYECVAAPSFICGLGTADGMVLPIYNSYSIESSN